MAGCRVKVGNYGHWQEGGLKDFGESQCLSSCIVLHNNFVGKLGLASGPNS